MTLTLELAPEMEARLRDRATREGRDETTVALGLLSDSLTRGDAEAPPAPGWPHGFFEQTYGSLADDPLIRPPQGEWEEREA